ncbi:inner centromere protein-like [Camellia sinensis]|uniref:inner centromere protein-like n=1 Tax=Camellia sinensis TaxID=4442 RepID=UPI001035CA55|nr:inner centromere protein-like [Camellia sinensis]
MKATVLAGGPLNKVAVAKGEWRREREKLGQVKAQLENLKRESVDWRRAVRSACARGLEEAKKAKKMEVLAIVEGNVADRAHAELLAVKLELEDERRKVVSLEFQLAGKQKKLQDAQNACTVATERFEEAMINNEELRAQQIKEKDEADVKIAGLQKELEDKRARAIEGKARLQEELEEEKTKAASERAAYPDLCIAAVEQFKGPAEFQMAINAAVASNLAREMFRRKAEELFSDLDLSGVRIDEDDVAQTPLDEGVEEEDLVSSEEE